MDFGTSLKERSGLLHYSEPDGRRIWHGGNSMRSSKIGRIESMENQWSSSGKYSEESLRWRSSTRFKRWWHNYSANQSTSKTGSSSCQGTIERCEHNPQLVSNYARKIPRGRWSFLGPGSEKKWYGTYTDRPGGSWDLFAAQMMANFSGSGHPIFRASSAFERGELRSKEGRKKTMLFNCSDENIELLLRTVICANQLSVCGAVAEMCNEWSEDLNAIEKPKAPDCLDKMEISAGLSIAEIQASKDTSKDSNKCPTTRSYPNYAPKQVWDESRLDNSSILFRHQEKEGINLYPENIRCLEMKKKLM